MPHCRLIDRANHACWIEDGSLTLGDRARHEVARLVDAYQPSRLPDEIKRELTRLMESEARRSGMDRLP